MKKRGDKVRRIYGDKVVIGFAGSVADAFALSEKFEAKLEEFGGSLQMRRLSLHGNGVWIKRCASWKRC